MVRIFNNIKTKILISFFIIAQYFFFLPYTHSAIAADYSISYYITYTVKDNKYVTVDYNIKLTNLSDSLYAASQSLTIPQTDITNLRVISSDGTPQSSQISKATDTTTITTDFSNPALGSGSIDDWDIVYDTTQVSSYEGHTLNLLIPGFENKASLNISNVTISVVAPTSFGNINFSSPTPSSTSTQNGDNIFTFNSDKIDKSGVNIILGDNEIYSFRFNYPLSNTSNNTQAYTIAVPPDTSTQKVSFTKIAPKPDTFSINNDGDYILSYNLGSNRNGSIDVEGIAEVSSTYSLLNNKLSKPIDLPHDQVIGYTSGMKYWEVNNAQIKNLAKKLTLGKTTNIDKAKAIYDYIVSNFKYNKNALNDQNRQRKGALYAINHPDDVICQEYVDAFVALSRAAGVPAVFDAGYGNTLSPLNTLPPNVLHAWAEFYDRDYGWVPVDPTWASTSGENYFGNVGSSHFELAKYGQDSSNPALVLAFVSSTNQGDNIKLLPTDSSFNDDLNYQNVNSNMNVYGGIENDANFQILNTGNRVMYLKNSSVSLNNNSYPSNVYSDKYIFPSMIGLVSYKIKTGSLLTFTHENANISYEYTSFDEKNGIQKQNPLQIFVSPPWYIYVLPILAVILIFVLSYLLVNASIKIYRKVIVS